MSRCQLYYSSGTYFFNVTVVLSIWKCKWLTSSQCDSLIEDFDKGIKTKFRAVIFWKNEEKNISEI